jgi:anti-sigma factor RsiW
MTPSGREDHVSQDDLLRYLDGELSPGERARAGGHLDGCAACAVALGELRARSGRVDALLRELDAAPAEGLPPRTLPAAARRRRGWQAPSRRAAVAAGLLLGAAALAPPLRAAAGDWLAGAWAALAGSPRQAPAPSPAPPAAQTPSSAAGSGVRLAPRGDEFVLEFATRQAGGTLTVRPEPGPEVAVEAAGAGGAPLLVLPGGVRIRNTAASTASYRVALPPAVRRVRVRVGGGAEVVVGRAGLGPGGRTVELAGQRGNRE